MKKPDANLKIWLKEQLFEAVPMGIAVIDKDFNLVFANKAFERMFGKWQNRKCYDVYKNRDSVCSNCNGSQTFQDGIPRVSEEEGYDRKGQINRYMKHTIPIIDENGQIPFLIEMSTDITESDKLQQEYQQLFDLVPCNIVIIDRDFRIKKANNSVRKLLGNVEGRHCYHGLKGFEHKCTECTARQTFEDGKLHTGHHIWRTKAGKIMHLHVITIPLRVTENGFNEVMEMAVDVTQTIELKDGLNFAHTFLETMIAASMDGIFAVDKSENVSVFNPAARKLFNIPDDQLVTRSTLAGMLPTDFLEQVQGKSDHVLYRDTEITDTTGNTIPARLLGNRLLMDGQSLGMAFFVQDLRAIKKLQNEHREAERLATVGQTVAGLAHGIKNLITALEGGMYMLNSGINKSKIDRVQKGMEMLGRNIERISLFVKAFLDFSKGREIRAAINHPTDIAKEVVEMYAPKAKRLGIRLEMINSENVRPAAIDFDSMHECLTNLVGNAIDAIRISETGTESFVKVGVYEDNDNIIYEVTDNGCGMDYELKQKIFTTFFTTKGLGGTGLGLLSTKKIVHEHGGKIELTSSPGQGTTFEIILPRDRLPKIIENDKK